MPLLSPEISARQADNAVAYLRDPVLREALRATGVARASSSPSLGPNWPDMITFAHVAAAEFAWVHSLTLREAAKRAGIEPIDLALDVLAASSLECTAVMAAQHARPPAERARVFSYPGYMGGSDGIFIGAHPHPRAAGTFARYLREYVRELRTWTWMDAVHHLSTLPARRFGLGRRGILAAGAVAELLLVDHETVADTATYDHPTALAVGIDDAFVAGVQVLASGFLTGATPGRGLCRARSVR